MSAAYVVVTVLAAAMVGFSAASVFAGAKWVVQPLADYGVPRPWWPWLGVAKAAGAAGLLVGLVVPVIGVVAVPSVALTFTIAGDNITQIDVIGAPEHLHQLDLAVLAD